jgi:N-acetyl-gamma-glutamyl-phosphate reductase
MYKYSFRLLSLEHAMALAAPLTADRSSTPRPEPRPRVAVAGATGYAGQELVRILARHPAVSLTAAMSSGATSAPRPLPALARIWNGTVTALDIDRLATDADIVFLALPEAASAELAPKLLERGLRVIDLSGAFRIRSDADRQRWYPATDALPAGTVYGMTESHKDALPKARLVSNPGCYPTAALMALEPLARAGLLDGPIIIDAKSGISGAGKAATDRTHFSENHGSVAAYGIFSHRHTAEIEQELATTVTFVPHLVPLDRGILETIYVTLKRGTAAQAVGDALEQAYADAPFVRLTGANLPEIKHVAHTNFCDIGWRVDPSGRAVIVSVIDNLVKGASVTRKPSTCCLAIPAVASAASISLPPPCTTTSDAFFASDAMPRATRSRSAGCSSSSPPSFSTMRVLRAIRAAPSSRRCRA